MESQSHVSPHSFPTAHFAPSLRLAIIACGVGHSTWLSQDTDSLIHSTSSASVMSAQDTGDGDSQCSGTKACLPPRRAHVASEELVVVFVLLAKTPALPFPTLPARAFHALCLKSNLKNIRLTKPFLDSILQVVPEVLSMLLGEVQLFGSSRMSTCTAFERDSHGGILYFHFLRRVQLATPCDRCLFACHCWVLAHTKNEQTEREEQRVRVTSPLLHNDSRMSLKCIADV